MNYRIIILMNTILITTITGIKPIVSLYAYSMGHSPQEISLFMAASALFPAFLALQIGKWVDHIGTRPIVILGNGLFLAALGLSAVYPSFLSFLLQLAMIGIASTSLMLCLQKRIGSLGGEIDRAVANYSLFGSVGAMIGPVMSAYLYDYYGYQTCVLVNMVIISIALLSEMGMRDADGTSQPKAQEVEWVERESIWTLMRNSDLRNAILIGALLFSTRELFTVYFPLLAQNMGVSPTMIGILLSFSGFSMLLIRFTQTSLVRAFGRMKILTWSLFATGLIFLLTPFSPWVVVLFLLIGILGAGLGLGQPLSTSSILEATLAERRGEVLGAQMTLNRLSQFAIPLFFGGIGGLIGVSAIFWGSGLMLLAFGYITRALPTDVDSTKDRNQSM